MAHQVKIQPSGRTFTVNEGETVPAAALLEGWLRYVPVLSDEPADSGWTGRRGFVHRAVMEDFSDLSAHQVYACGVPIVVESAHRDFATQCGLPEEGFFSDSFTPSVP